MHGTVFGVLHAGLEHDDVVLFDLLTTGLGSIVGLGQVGEREPGTADAQVRVRFRPDSVRICSEDVPESCARDELADEGVVRFFKRRA